jgi:hypothetical protein
LSDMLLTGEKHDPGTLQDRKRGTLPTMSALYLVIGGISRLMESDASARTQRLRPIHRARKVDDSSKSRSPYFRSPSMLS